MADEQGRTPLYFAVLLQREDLVAELIKAGANPNIGDCQGQRPLHLACGDASPLSASIARLLLNNGADVTVTDAEVRAAGACFGCERQSVTVVRNAPRLIRGAMSFCCLQGSTPLTRLCATHHDAHLVHLLIEKGSDVNHRDGRGLTPLMQAALMVSLSKGL